MLDHGGGAERDLSARQAAGRAREGGAAGALIGVRFLWSEPPLRALVLTGMAVVSLFSALDAVVMPVFLRDSGRDAADLGSFLALAGGGAIVSALAYAASGSAWASADPLASLALETLAFAAGAAGRRRADAAVRRAGRAGRGPLNPLISTALLRGTPAAIRGRVLSAFNALALVATPLAALLAGAAIELAGTRAVMICLAAMFALLALPYLLAPPTRRPAPRAPPRPPTGNPPDDLDVPMSMNAASRRKTLLARHRYSLAAACALALARLRAGVARRARRRGRDAAGRAGLARHHRRGRPGARSRSASR